MEKTKKENKSYALEIFKAVFVALIISLLLVLLSAFIIDLAGVSPSVTPVINQIIKGLSIFAAAVICLKLPKNGWLRGLLFGLCYTVLSFIVFSMLDGMQFSFGLQLLNDIAFSAVSGLVSGVVSVNFLHKRSY